MLTILHLLDATTPSDALDLIALLRAQSPDHAHHLAALGHHSTANLAALAGGGGIPTRDITFLPSAGWADPTGWRALKKLLRKIQPTHLHAWGVPAAVALHATRKKIPAPRLLTLSALPSHRHQKILRFLQSKIKNQESKITSTSPAITSSLTTLGFPATLKPLPIPTLTPPTDLPAFKASLGLASTDGPVILLAGEDTPGSSPRYDLALWTLGILQQLFPNVRALVREDPRRRSSPSLDKYFHDLADPNLLVIAPHHSPWSMLIHAAHILLVTADAPHPIASILAAMTANVPIVSTPAPILGLLVHDKTALISQGAEGRSATHPRPIVHQLERLLTTPWLRAKLTDSARHHAAENFSQSRSLATFNALYAATPATAPTA